MHNANTERATKATLDCAGNRKSLNMLTFAKIKIDIKR